MSAKQLLRSRRVGGNSERRSPRPETETRIRDWREQNLRSDIWMRENQYDSDPPIDSRSIYQSW